MDNKGGFAFGQGYLMFDKSLPQTCVLPSMVEPRSEGESQSQHLYIQQAGEAGDNISKSYLQKELH